MGSISSLAGVPFAIPWLAPLMLIGCSRTVQKSKMPFNVTADQVIVASRRAREYRLELILCRLLMSGTNTVAIFG